MKRVLGPGTLLLATITVCLMSLSCASAPTKIRTTEIELTTDATVTVGSDQATQRKKGETVEVTEQPVLVEAPGMVSTLVVPFRNDMPSKVTLTPRPLENWLGEQATATTNRMLHEVMVEVTNIQVMLSRGKAREALAATELLQTRHPNLAYLQFLKASCQMVLGDRGGAKATLEAAVKNHPDQKAGLELYRGLATEGATKND